MSGIKKFSTKISGVNYRNLVKEKERTGRSLYHLVNAAISRYFKKEGAACGTRRT